MIPLPNTSQIVDGAEYHDSASSFFANFGTAFELARSQIIKVETRQVYREPGNPSYEALEQGDWEASMALMNESRSVDLELYKSLKDRGVDFLRCRPLAFPLSSYMRWELEVYKFNTEHCERVFCCNIDAVDRLFKDHINHDFIVFDARIAFIHHYDAKGEIAGGWMTEDISKIIALQSLFIFLKSHCQPFEMYLND